MGRKRDPSRVALISRWIRSQSQKTKIALSILFAIGTLCLLVIRYTTRRYDYYSFVLAEAAQAAAICVLIFKLHSQKSCSGISLKAQELTAIYLAVRVYIGFSFELELHTWLDVSTLAATLWIIYMMRVKLKSTYNKDQDTLPLYYVVTPAAVLAVIVHPYSRMGIIDPIVWSFCLYVDSVAVLPQLRLIQNAKMVEPFTAHYVFGLGIARFLGCAYWIIMIIETGGQFLYFWGHGSIWFLTNIIAEIIQTFILADFVYYYGKGVMAGERLVLPLPV